jgi:diacylglycerol kinase family enzyme
MFMAADPAMEVSTYQTRATMRVLLLVNSSASSVTPRGKVVIQKALSADHDVTVAETNRRNHASRLAQGAARDGYDVVVALGGDGTLNEAANGLAGTDTALAALPGGSTNVFARTIGLPNDPIEATGVLLEGLAADKVEDVGLGNVNGRYFLFHVGIGFDAAVVEQVERRAQLKRWAGHPLFVFSAFTTWFRHYDKDEPRFEVAGTPAYFTIVLNTNPYTYLGNRPLDLVPEATLDRGLASITFRDLRFVPLIRAVGAALAGSDIRRQRSLDVRTDLTDLLVTADRPFPYQVDGDYLGDVTRLEFRHEPAALRLVLPG